MAHATFLAHLPRFRMAPDHFAFAPGIDLVKLTWEGYNSITLGAFADWRRRYEQADPVFVMVEVDLDTPLLVPGSLPHFAMLELKGPLASFQDLIPQISYGLTKFHDLVVDQVWACLLLALPGASPGSPRNSVTAMLPGDGTVLRWQDQAYLGIRIQGEFDQEYVYSGDTACTPIELHDLLRAAALMPVVGKLRDDELLANGLNQLMAVTSPALAPGERLVLAISTLEGLLLSEVRGRRQQDALAAGVVDLLGPGAETRTRDLYRARSRAVHYGPAAAADTIEPGLAEQLLADVLVASVGGEPSPGRALRGSGRPERLNPRPLWCSATLTTGVSLSAPEGYLVSWSPLVGLLYDEDPCPTAIGALLTRFSVQEIVSMEEKDIRRDFIKNLAISDELGTRQPVAGLAVLLSTGAGRPGLGPDRRHRRPTLDDASLMGFGRPRDLAVLGLRIAGVDGFLDPELLGWYVYDGRLRYRKETVYRQTALMVLNTDDQHMLTQQQLGKAREVWRLLADYCAHPMDPRIEMIFDQFRRAHDPYLMPEARALLLFVVLEALLGPFRSKRDAVQLEDLVSGLANLDGAACSWMTSDGWAARNAVAHGARTIVKEGPELAYLRSICSSALQEMLFLRTTTGESLVDHLKRRFT